MLEYFNNRAQPAAGKVDISDHSVIATNEARPIARWYRQPSSQSRAAVLYSHGGMLAYPPPSRRASFTCAS